MDRNTRKLDESRVQHSEVENHYIDELVAGRLSRRAFLRRGSVIGLSVPTMGAILAACGGACQAGRRAARGQPDANRRGEPAHGH
jgi:peptide/nickel transport system substrate-binding protein